ncbi:DUF397 domain-containing protein [Streptomyces thermoalcalitolerans]|uniref:DUF397 domain-containing protein n=1 Tax=Streptomyces thermoalcalitolerans TaxID=65605 RepID=A0ABN1P7Q8_9ACTN
MNEPLAWSKSSYSSSGGGECLEVAVSPCAVYVRDSKLGERSPRFEVPAEAWAEFLAYAAREA